VSNDETLAKAIIELGFACKADTFIIPMQDVCLLNGDYRMNTPGVEMANWAIKIPEDSFTNKTASYLKRLTNKYNRA
jgi:4-alpha-glucanotransferase